jgi:hypothetical protein
LQIEAGHIYHPALKTFVEIGLPWGPKPRLILAHLNAEAMRQRSPVIEIESSLSAFVKRIRGFQHGREIRAFKDQLARISNGSFRFAVETATGPEQTNAYIITNFKLWPEKDERQRVLWPTEIRFSTEYFESLQDHAVPLNEADLAALAHSALAIDLYCWLAQRLHRVNPNRPAFIQWPALKQQFGPDYGRMDHFKEEFRKKLRQIRWPEVTNGPFLSHKRTERERRRARVAEFRRKRRLSLRTALTAAPPLYRSLKTGNPLFPLDITLRPFRLCPLMREI